MASLKVGINADAKQFVETKAQRLQESEAEIVRRALELYRFMDGVKEADGEIVLRRKDGDLERLVRI
jgi:hypothetical protein